MRTITSVSDLRERARRRVPRMMFDYADRGSYDEITLRRNREDLAAIEFRQRVMVDLSRRELATTLAGEAAMLPVAIAPTGLAGMFWPDGEIVAARAARDFGVPYTLSTLSICSIEDVRAAVGGPFWFQLYLMKDRGFSADLIARAQAAGCTTLMLTLDLQVQGLRRRDPRNGLSIPPRVTWRNVLDVARRPGWVAGVLLGRRRTFGNLAGRVGRPEGLGSLAQWIAAQMDPSMNWSDLDWVRAQWPGRLIVKGVLDADDALRAVRHGADAVVVSNHGGRQLDGAASTISVLPEIVDAAGDRAEILFDGGVMCGQDVLKALALGARGCLIGKAHLYGLAAAGGPGVTRVLELIRDELSVSMALTGCCEISAVDRGVIRRVPWSRSP
ncbi:MAG: alpha-hydroxy acid oxidase [Steroidobacteraceae bacterium]